MNWLISTEFFYKEKTREHIIRSLEYDYRLAMNILVRHFHVVTMTSFQPTANRSASGQARHKICDILVTLYYGTVQHHTKGSISGDESYVRKPPTAKSSVLNKSSKE